MEISVPPLTMLALILALLTGAAAVVAWLGWGCVSLIVSSLAVAFFTAAMTLAWMVFARHQTSWRAMLALPELVLGILPIAWTYWIRRQKWAPTTRDNESGQPLVESEPMAGGRHGAQLAAVGEPHAGCPGRDSPPVAPAPQHGEGWP
jgi:hypothetical protein